jgi:bacteriocin-like protein
MNTLNDNQLNAVSGGAAHANGQYWTEGGATYYRIAPNDYLGNIAQMFGTSPYAIQQLNPGKIKNIDVIRAGDVIRVR